MIAAAKRAEAFAPTLNEYRLAGRFPINPIPMELMMQTHITDAPAGATMCPICGTSFVPARRSQRTCTEACKKRLARTENRDAKARISPLRLGSYRTPPKREKRRPQAIDFIQGSVPVFDDLSPSTPLVFERINEITVKVTDGVKVRHVGSNAFAGADQTRALAWLMDIGWVGDRQAWIVRFGALAFGPTTFSKAKRAASLLLQGGLEEAVVRLIDAPARLNRHQSHMLVSEGRA